MRTAKRNLLTATGTVALLFPAVAMAQAAAEDDRSQEEIVVTAQRANQTQVDRGGSAGVLGDKPAEDLPFSIKSYNDALILNQQPQTIGQVLDNDPSVRTTYGGGIAGEQFVIRGFTLYGDDVGLNGLYGIAPRQLISPELYAQVQVLNGSTAFLNGAAPGGSGIGGSVNLMPKRADRPLLRATANYSGTRHFGGSVDVGRRFANNAVGVRVNGVYRAGDVGIEDEYRRNAMIGAAFDWRSDRVRVSLDVAYQNVLVRELRPLVQLAAGVVGVPRVPGSRHNYAQPWTRTQLRDVFGVVKAEWDVTDNAMLYVIAGARDGAEDGQYGGIQVRNLATGAATGTASYVPRSDNNEAVTAGLRTKLAAGGITQEINFGGSFSWQVNRNAYQSFATYTTNLYDTPDTPFPTRTVSGGNLADPYPVSRIAIGSAFVSDTFGFAEDRVLLTAGLRLQSIVARRYAYLPTTTSGGVVQPGGQTSRYAEDAITPVIGLVVKPVEGLSLFANRIEALVQGPVAPTNVPNLANPGEIFPPYRGLQYEVGGKLSLGRFNASIAAFQIDQPTAYSVPDATNPTLLRYGLFGEQRNRGLELSIDGEPLPGLRVIAGGSLNDARLRRTLNGVNQGNRAFGIPEYLANANVEWDFLPGATVTGRVIQTGRQMVNAANSVELPEWTRFDLGGRYVTVVGDTPITFRVNVDNVADRRYWASAFGAFGTAFLQGAPRTFKASATVDF